MKYVVYKILNTATITTSHREAVEHYRQGCEIAVLSSIDGVNWRQHALWVH